MGRWGEFDHMSDTVSDLAAELEDMSLPEHIKSLKLYESKKVKKNTFRIWKTKETKQNVKKRSVWILKTLNVFWKNLKKLMKKRKMTDHEIAGIAMRMAAEWTGSKKMKFKLPQKFPKWLKTEAKKASERLLIEVIVTENEMGWFDVNDRIDALKQQILLFS